jgi:glucokinase
MGHGGVSARTGAAPWPRLVGDIGGTHVRFAWVEGPGDAPGRRWQRAWGDTGALEPLLDAYRAEQGLPVPAACAIGVAAPVIDGVSTLTNAGVRIEAAALAVHLGCSLVRLLNDYTVLAWALPALAGEDVRAIGGGRAIAGGPCAVLGPGTGLGVSALLRGPAGAVPLAGEGGHASVSAADADEDRLVEWLRRRHGHVSAERVLSGPGLVELYDAVCATAGRSALTLTPPDVLARAATDPDCDAAIERFCAFLGGFAGNLALTLGARGGVYVAGGIAARLGGERLERSAFRERFEAKGRFRGYLAAIPTALILDPAGAALRGANLALDAGA